MCSFLYRLCNSIEQGDKILLMTHENIIPHITYPDLVAIALLLFLLFLRHRVQVYTMKEIYYCNIHTVDLMNNISLIKIHFIFVSQEVPQFGRLLEYLFFQRKVLAYFGIICWLMMLLTHTHNTPHVLFCMEINGLGTSGWVTMLNGTTHHVVCHQMPVFLH